VGWILTLLLIFYFPIFGQNEKKILVVDEPGKSVLKMFAFCQYTLVLKEPKDKEIKISITQLGDGYFAGEHNDNRDYIVTIDHLLRCNSTISDLEKSGILQEINRGRDEDLGAGNITALKDSKKTNISAYTHEGASVYDIGILYNSSFSKDDSDKALLRGTVDKEISHNHFPLMEDKVFDSVFYKNGITKEVEVRGFLFMKGGWQFRFKNAEIESLWPDVFRINELLDQGLSGSPAAYLHEGTLYAIGAVANAPSQESGRVFDMSHISIIKKSFLEKRNKK
jgi:hypothetical protein